MIRHRPYGSGHAYATTNDQRVPVLPLAGAPVELRVRASERVSGVVAEWDDGTDVVVLPLTPWDPASEPDPPSTGDGHLAAAQERALGGGPSWRTTTPPLAAGRRHRYRFRMTGGPERVTRWFEVCAGQWRPDGGRLEVDGRDLVVPGSVEWLVSPDGVHRVRFALPLAPGEHVVGFGERFDRVDQRGHALDAVVFEQYKDQGATGRTYLPMPFATVVGGDGWGFHVRTSRRTWFDVGATTPDRLVVEAETGPEGRIELAVYDGAPAKVLDAFLGEAGRPEELPAWVFRLWASGNEWNTQERVLAEMDRHRDEDVPVGVVVIEAWSDESTFVAFRDARYEVHEDGSPHRLADFAFPPEGAWPDPKGMVDDLHARGVRVLLWQIPLQRTRPHPRGQARADARVMVEKGYGVKEADGRPYRNRGWWFPLALLPDFTDPEAREWWLAKRRYLVDEVGIDGFKTDGGEHAWGSDLRHADGTRGDEGNNLVPVRYAAAFGDLLRACGRSPVTFSRAGFTGSQAHGCFWAGDENSTWEAFRHSVTAGITASACGVLYWGWDLAGFSGDVPGAELYLRAAAMACFAPIMQYHSEFNHHRRPSRDRTPWNIAARTGDERVLPVFRSLAHLRERLVPYLAEQARDGLPLMRGLFFAWPDDPRIWDRPRQYLLGDALLVHPVTEPGARTWETYLPAGGWVDVWSGARHEGGGAVSRDVPVDVIPVYCREDRWPSLREVFHPGS
ncbi:glycoside hydrolase family 31 protein [Microbispora sp. ATCC PTA-5024]|uniref:glycoside hydrolase family 31 protein n=1 Tax=Microbispora sp. ATCC PTA-5024 TaxID=316330 RepID=UPI0003DDB9CD|nr:TIM-barrel domain-containing protein [Microbispora sp. ATCC PTA-5024]ETK34076.1 alpha-glucosidase [Microbispora sp. ATCC PTA-5024]